MTTYMIEIEIGIEDVEKAEDLVRTVAERVADHYVGEGKGTISAYELNVGLSTICSGDLLAEYIIF